MARIGIDAHSIGEQLTGNETYTSNLIDGLLGLGTDHEFVLFFNQADAASQWMQNHQEFEHVKTIVARPSQPMIRIPMVLPWLVWKHEMDLLHVNYVGPPWMTAPLVTSIHDISFERHPEFFSPREVMQFKLTFPLTARRARRVLTISEYSRRDLIEIYGLPEEKVVMVYLGVNERFHPQAGQDNRDIPGRYGINQPYLMAVGNLQPRKNLVRLIAAYTRLRNARPDIRHQLVIVGKKAWKHDPILDFLRKSRWVDDIILTDYVPDDDLPALYALADALIYPSLYEGFGLPLLEAMACGTPVVASDRTSMPEVVGSAGILVDPYDLDGIAAAMAAIILDPETAQWFKHAGIARARSFTWRNSALGTLRAYESVLEEAKCL